MKSVSMSFSDPTDLELIEAALDYYETVLEDQFHKPGEFLDDEPEFTGDEEDARQMKRCAQLTRRVTRARVRLMRSTR